MGCLAGSIKHCTVFDTTGLSTDKFAEIAGTPITSDEVLLSK